VVLENKVAVIYGAGGGVGSALARAFAREGARLFLAGRHLANIQPIAAEMNGADAAQVDVLDEESVERHMDQVIGKAGQVDISFNAAGIAARRVEEYGMQGLPLAEFYDELVTTQRAFYRKHLGWRRVMNTAGVIARHLVHGQTNFVRSLFLLNRVFRPESLLADHALPVAYQMPLPRPAMLGELPGGALYIHPPRGRKGRAIDNATERFVEETRMGATP